MTMGDLKDMKLFSRAAWAVLPLLATQILWITTRYGTKMTRTWRDLFGRVGEFNARIENNVSGMRVVQAFANEDHEREPRRDPAGEIDVARRLAADEGVHIRARSRLRNRVAA